MPIPLSKTNADSSARRRQRRRMRAAVLVAAMGASAGGLLGALPASAATAAPTGYYIIGGNGALFPIGGALNAGLGSPLSLGLSHPIVGIAGTADGQGYWAAASDGGVLSYGDAAFHGSMGGKHLNAPIVAIVATADQKGYWLVGADGGIFNFGDAEYFGSLPAMGVKVKDIVAMSPTSDGLGAWFLGADGSVFAVGDAPYFGNYASKSSTPSSAPFVGIAGSPAGNGYLIANAAGAVYAFGSSFFGGSPLLSGITTPVEAIQYTADGQGYWILGNDGGIYSYGDAPYLGSVPGELADAGVSTPVPLVAFAIAY